jgi:hypothetical protein
LDENVGSIVARLTRIKPSFFEPERLVLPAQAEGPKKECQEKGVRILFLLEKGPDAFLNPVRVGAEPMIVWTADWIARGGAALGKPSHFEARDGKF